MRVDGGIDGFAALLGKAGLELGAEEMADALWLARHISPGEREQVVEEEDIEEEAVEPTIREEYLDSELEDDEDEAQLPLSLPQKQDGDESGAVKPDGIPIKAPAAPALRIRLELARALRPLRRRVPSPVKVEFDQAATIDRIADQGIWSPVLSPAFERWLDVALVIEESKSAPLWKETLAEFQTLLERQGAFRSVSSWRLRSDATGELTLLSRKSSRPRSARELLDSTGRRLILVVSDCTSLAWQRGKIYSWLETWGERASMTVIQLLPERLWAQTGLAHGVPMWLSALEPGVPSARMMATAQMPLWDLLGAEQEQVMVPVVSLEVEPLKQWARVVSGVEESRTVGFQFNKRENLEVGDQETEKQLEISAEERVRLFRATASLTAQKLAGLMSVAPVNPPIVNLIRQTMLPEAEPIHVAEVYMGGLMKAQTNNRYEFISEVRDVLNNAISVTDIKKVLDQISRYISERLGLGIHSFEAFLYLDIDDSVDTQEIFKPFAKIAIQTLKRIGYDFSVIVEQTPRCSERQNLHHIINRSVWTPPPLKTYNFQETTLVQVAQVEITIENNLPGRVRFNNLSWAARLYKGSDEEHVIIPKGDTVGILGREGNTLLVQWLTFNDENESLEHDIERYGLTPREAEVWRLRWQGYSYRETAEQLYISDNTVKKHMKNIYEKIHLAGETQNQREYGLKKVLFNPFEDMVRISSGSMVMGISENENQQYENEKPRHRVALHSFLISVYPITQAQWRAVTAMPKINYDLEPDPSYFKGDRRPVENVSWLYAMEFCERLSQANNNGLVYRLPTEAEWEYACRAKTVTPFSFGRKIKSSFVNFKVSENQDLSDIKYTVGTTKVGSFPANAFGLHDMHGNVWEWCLDQWHDTYDGAPSDGSAWIDSTRKKERVIRGGSWNSYPEDCRASKRCAVSQRRHRNDIGFRIVCTSADS